ncbi:MAG: hypothetical protein K2N10_05365 [Muribaculaceae bacterium]|nr:hypothetical protein [Muribaculaceae bacterium]
MLRQLLTLIMTAISIMASSQTKIILTNGDRSMTATTADNGATRRLLELLSKGPITISMSDYGGFEKVGALPEALPASDTRITTSAGDIMLYQGNQMVIFYGTNSWSYTRLGKIDNATATEVRQFLGNGDIRLTIRQESSAANSIRQEVDEEQTIYDLTGKRVDSRPLKPGIYLINGKKTRVQ